jgi:hypothetical protein
MTESTPNDADQKTGTMHYSLFGREVHAREAHLAALPGKVLAEWFDSLNRASQVFSGNSRELVRHLSRFVGTMRHVRELPDEFDVEANRLLRNYLGSLATLRDVQRSINNDCCLRAPPPPHHRIRLMTFHESAPMTASNRSCLGAAQIGVGLGRPSFVKVVSTQGISIVVMGGVLVAILTVRTVSLRVIRQSQTAALRLRTTSVRPRTTIQITTRSSQARTTSARAGPTPESCRRV